MIAEDLMLLRRRHVELVTDAGPTADDDVMMLAQHVVGEKSQTAEPWFLA